MSLDNANWESMAADARTENSTSSHTLWGSVEACSGFTPRPDPLYTVPLDHRKSKRGVLSSYDSRRREGDDEGPIRLSEEKRCVQLQVSCDAR